MAELLDEMPGQPAESVSFLQILVENVGIEAISERVARPLEGLAVAPYYGCLVTRPGELMAFDDVEDPVSMDRILEANGASVPHFPHKVECCGASFGVPRKDVTRRLSSRILSVAARVGARAVVVACPLCHMNLDLRQSQLRDRDGSRFHMPIFYITQLLGIALGAPFSELGLDKHAVRVAGLLEEVLSARDKEEAS